MQHKEEKMAKYNSSLILQKMVFDKIEFTRKGFKNENELLISEFFYFTVKKGQELNLISNKVIEIDGTFLKVNAGINNRAS